jgi:hypothetical protein
MGTPDQIDVVLPGTTILGDDRVVGARLRPLAGLDESFTLEQSAHLGALAAASALLSRCVTDLRLASGATVPAAGLVPDLTVGDREALLLRLRQVSFGDRLALVVNCPDPACGEAMDLELTVNALCHAHAERVSAVHEAAAEGEARPIRFRLPTGADLEAAARVSRENPDLAAEAVARRCLIDPDLELTQELMALLNRQIGELDPQAETELALTCPACGRSFTTELDAGELLCDELAARGRDLELGVHLLAFHYHWSESDILALSTARRRRYLATLTDGLSAAAG